MIFSSFRPLDYILLIFCILLVFFSIYGLSFRGQDGILYAEVGDEEANSYIMPLSRDDELKLMGPVGETLIVVEDSTVRVLASDCRDQLCVAKGRIEKSLEWVACLPNKVFIQIRADASKKRQSGSLDALTF